MSQTSTMNPAAVLILAGPAFLAGAAAGQVYSQFPGAAISVAVLVTVVLGAVWPGRIAGIAAMCVAAAAIGVNLTGGGTGGAEALGWAAVTFLAGAAVMSTGALRVIYADAACVAAGVAVSVARGARFDTLSQFIVLAGLAGALVWVARLLGAAISRREAPDSVTFAVLTCAGAAQLTVNMEGELRVLLAGVLVAVVAAVLGRAAGGGMRPAMRGGVLVLAAVLATGSAVVLGTNRGEQTAAPVVLAPQGGSPTGVGREPNNVDVGAGVRALSGCTGAVSDRVACLSERMSAIYKTSGASAMVAVASRWAEDPVTGDAARLCHAALTRAAYEILDAEPKVLWAEGSGACNGGFPRGLWMRTTEIRDPRILFDSAGSLCNRQRGGVEGVASSDTLEQFQWVCPSVIGVTLGRQLEEGPMPGVDACMDLQSGTWMLAGATTDCLEGVFLGYFTDDVGAPKVSRAQEVCAGVTLSARNICVQQAGAARAAGLAPGIEELFSWCGRFPAGEDESCAKGVGAGLVVRSVFDRKAISSACAQGGDLRLACAQGAVRALSGPAGGGGTVLCQELGADLVSRCRNEAEAAKRPGILEYWGIFA